MAVYGQRTAGRMTFLRCIVLRGQGLDLIMSLGLSLSRSRSRSRILFLFLSLLLTQFRALFLLIWQFPHAAEDALALQQLLIA